MPDAMVIQFPRTYRCSFTTESDAAVAHVAVVAAGFGVFLDIRAEDPSDSPEPPGDARSDLGPDDFRGSDVRLGESF